MSEMVERAAKAAYEALFVGDWPDTGASIDADGFRKAACAAIAAMREPTPEMIAAVENDAVIQGGLDDCNQHDIPEKSWRLMIDAALK